MLFVTGCLGASAFADSEAQEITVHEQRAIVAEFQELLEAEYVLEDNLSLFTGGFESSIEAGLYSQPQSTEDFSKVYQILQEYTHAWYNMSIPISCSTADSERLRGRSADFLSSGKARWQLPVYTDRNGRKPFAE